MVDSYYSALFYPATCRSLPQSAGLGFATRLVVRSGELWRKQASRRSGWSSSAGRSTSPPLSGYCATCATLAPIASPLVVSGRPDE